jgi:uncharacterized protein (TIGR03437 family)
VKNAVRFLPGLLFAVTAVGQTPTFSQLYTFPFTVNNTSTGNGYSPNGTMPTGPLLQASDGNFYGTTMLGGDDGQCSKPPTTGNPIPECAGTVFQLTPAGKLTVLHTFSWEGITTPYADGSTPNGGLVEGPDGYLYGSASRGGVNMGQAANSGNGIIFRISKTGTFQNLHTFCTGSTCTEGRFPTALVLGLDGKFYGTTTTTIFRVSASGVLETLHTFSGIPDGGNPLGGLIQGSDCNFYGTTLGGGPTANSAGTVFRITPGGVYTVLYSFSSAAGAPLLNGISPRVGLVQASNGKLYGVTTREGVYGWGTIFEVDLAGNFRVVYNLNNPNNKGGGPTTALWQASDGNLWGTGFGPTVYALSTAGTLVQSTIFTCAQSDTSEVTGPLIQGTDGKLYAAGTPGNCANTAGLTTFTAGTIFSVSAGLPPLPNPRIAAVTNGASFAAGSLVPGEIATAFGTSLTTGTGINLSSSLPLPGSLLGSQVLVNGCPATPLFAVDNVSGQQQINFQAPWEIAGQQVVAVQVVNNGGTSPAVGVPVLAAQPGIINYSSGGNTYGAILHADYSLATTTSPATAGETVLIYGTALGAVSTAQVDGTAANGESTIALPSVTIGGAGAMVTFSGLAPGFVGLNQVNVVVPSGLANGNQAVVMNVDGVASNSVLLPVH